MKNRFFKEKDILCGVWKGDITVDKLIRKAMKGDADAFTELMEMNMQSMYKTAWVYLKNDMDIADAIQDTILACYENIDTLRNPKYFKTWMTRVLINKCNDIIRGWHYHEDIEVVSVEGKLDQQFESCEWKALLNSIEEKYSIVILMHYYDGMSAKEIGKVLGLNTNTVLTRLRRGRQQLRKELEISEQQITTWRQVL